MQSELATHSPPPPPPPPPHTHTHTHTHIHTHSNVEQILAAQGEVAKRVDDSTIELTPEDLAGVHKLSAALGEDRGESNAGGG